MTLRAIGTTIAVLLVASVQASGTHLAHAQDACSATLVDTLDAPGARLRGINNLGQVVGNLEYLDRALQPFVWQRGRARTLPTPQGNLGAYVEAINDLGRAVGSLRSSDQSLRPVTWFNGVMSTLRTPTGLDGSATDINSRGQIIGVVGGACVLWENIAGDYRVLQASECFATAINDRSEVAGYFRIVDGFRGFVWRNGVTTYIDPPPDPDGDPRYQEVMLYDINNQGLAVGTVISDLGEHPIVWTRQLGASTLTVAGSALAVNDWGTIAVRQYSPGGPHLLLADSSGRYRDRGALTGDLDEGDVNLNNLFQLAWAGAEAEPWRRPFFCQLR